MSRANQEMKTSHTFLKKHIQMLQKEFHDLLVKINEYTTLHDMAMLLLIPGSTRDITINLEKDSRNQMQMEQVRFGHRIDLDPVSPGHIDCVQLLKKMVIEFCHRNTRYQASAL